MHHPTEGDAAGRRARARRAPEAAALLREAEGLLGAGNVRDAHACAERAAHLAGDAPVRARALLVCGSASYHDAQYESAYLYASEAHALLRAAGDVKRALEAVETLVAVYCETGEFDRAVEAAKSGIELSVAQGAATMTKGLLYSLGQVLHRGGEYPEAIRCLSEAMAMLDARSPAGRRERLRYATELAFVHQAYGEHLAAHGQPSLAEKHFAAARATVADAPPAIEGGHTLLEIRSLEARVHLQATWHDWPAARRSAAIFLRIARRRESSNRTLAAAMGALSTLYAERGDLPRAVRYQRRSFELLSDLGLTPAVKSSMQRLAALHARHGEYAEALKWHKQAARLQATETGRNHALRCRLAALERESQRRAALAREQLLHARRMMVIGRLIGRIHHAMLRPLQKAHERVTEAARAVTDGRVAPRLAGLLRATGRELDEAASLTRQLKLFSYRSAPQVTALSLEAALRDAWEGLRLFGRPASWSLCVVPDAGGVEAQGDAQRMGILLTILLIELAPQGAGQTPRVIWAGVERGAGEHSVELRIRVSGDLGVAGEPSLGLALCTEIAQEMDGRLDGELEGMTVRGYRLTLPLAEAVSVPGPALEGPATLPGSRQARE